MVLVEEEEYDDYQEGLKSLKSSSVEKALSKTTKEANAKTKLAVEAKEKAEGELKLSIDKNEELVEENETKESELVELRARVEALEAANEDTDGEGGEGKPSE